jgi:hypothetical protein
MTIDTKINGVERIRLERVRQIDEKKYDQAHDDEHDDGEIALAAVCYASYAAGYRVFIKKDFAAGMSFVDPWPWSIRFDARDYGDGNALQDPNLNCPEEIRLLEKAGALIAAEIDRLLRVEDDS